MPVTPLKKKPAGALPVWLVSGPEEASKVTGGAAASWMKANGFDGQSGRLLLLPSADGALAGAALGIGTAKGGFTELLSGHLGKSLPAGDWYFANPPKDADLACLAAMLGGYRFAHYGKAPTNDVRLAVPETVDNSELIRVAGGVFLARDLVNTPACDMGPAALEEAACKLAQKYKARITTITGQKLVTANFPMIHAVGRAGADAPRLIDISWGSRNAPKVTLVGKGVTFDTGGLDIKPSASMLLMKKDMGGGANVLGLASMIMDARLQVCLRVLIPAVENSIAGNAFRPGDILKSRSGMTVEIGNTDAEGRLVLADALSLAVEDDPDLIVDMATLTGAARVALGPDLSPFYTDDDGLAHEIEKYSAALCDPVWRMPLWMPYDKNLSSKIADTNNVTKDSFAGSVTAALFLKKFVGKARSWAHFDILAWNPADRPHGPAGGEAQAIRALYAMLAERYPRK